MGTFPPDSIGALLRHGKGSWLDGLELVTPHGVVRVESVSLECDPARPHLGPECSFELSLGTGDRISRAQSRSPVDPGAPALSLAIDGDAKGRVQTALAAALRGGQGLSAVSADVVMDALVPPAAAGSFGSWLRVAAVRAFGTPDMPVRWVEADLDERPEQQSVLARVATETRMFEVVAVRIDLGSTFRSFGNVELTVRLCEWDRGADEIVDVREQTLQLGWVPGATYHLPAPHADDAGLADLFARWRAMWEVRLGSVVEDQSIDTVAPEALRPYPSIAAALSKYVEAGPAGPRPRRIDVDNERLDAFASSLKRYEPRGRDELETELCKRVAAFDVGDGWRIFFYASTQGRPEDHASIFLQDEHQRFRVILIRFEDQDWFSEFVDADGAVARDVAEALRAAIVQAGLDVAIEFRDEAATEYDDEYVPSPVTLALSQWLEFPNTVAGDLDGVLDWRVHRDVFDPGSTRVAARTPERRSADISAYHRFIREQLSPNFAMTPG